MKTLLNVHGDLPHALAFAYPEEKWVFGRFFFRDKWTNQQFVREFLDYCKKQLEIERPEEWYRISRKQIIQLGGSK